LDDPWLVAAPSLLLLLLPLCLCLLEGPLLVVAASWESGDGELSRSIRASLDDPAAFFALTGAALLAELLRPVFEPNEMDEENEPKILSGILVASACRMNSHNNRKKRGHAGGDVPFE
jgi:hypothetical protein